MWCAWGEMRNTFQILFVKYQWRVPLGVLRCRWKDDIKMDIKEISLDFGLDAWDLGGLWLVCMIRSLQVPLNIRNSSTN